MPSRRFYSPDLSPARIELDPTQSSHARKVLRLSQGDAVELFDGAGTVADGRVAEVRKTLTVELTERRSVPRPQFGIDLAVAVPKGDRADTLIEQASQLGADRLIPLLAKRSVVEPRANKLRRFERLAVESAKQCGRAWLMEIEPPTPLNKLLKSADQGMKLLADGTVAKGHTLQQALADRAQNLPQRVLVLIGPEGGWTRNEKDRAREAGFLACRLGPHNLRVETAAAAALAVLRAEA